MENAVLEPVEVVETSNTVIETQVCFDENLALVKARIAKLNKRAMAKGFPICQLSSELAYVGYELHDGGVIEKPNEYQLKKKCTGRVVPVYKVRLEFPKLSIGAWELIGALRPLQLEDGSWENLLNSVPGKEIPSIYAKTVAVCDHCGHKRHRTETFVVRHQETGEFKSVGRNCIKDFLGHDPSGMLWVYSQIEELSDEDGWEKEFGGKFSMGYDLPYLLALAFKCIAVDGWVSGKMAEFGNLTATSDIVSRIAGNYKPFDWSESRWLEYRTERSPSDLEMDRAGLAIEWAKSLTETSGYMRNVNLVARVGRVTEKEMGLAVSIAAAFLRATTDEVITKLAKAVEIDEYYGVEGTRIEIDVLVVRVIPIETSYGTSGLHIMRTLEGHSLKWFSSASEWLAEGDVCKIKASIKKHDIWQMKKQTTLSRCKIVKEKEPKAVEIELANAS